MLYRAFNPVFLKMYSYIATQVDWLADILLILAFVIFFVIIHASTQKWVKIKEGHEIVGYYIHQVSLIYAVMIGLIAVASWENFNRTQQYETTEGSSLANLYRIASHLPSNVKEPLQDEIISYARLMISDEWPAMQAGGESALTYKTAATIEKILSSFNPGTEAASNLQEESFSQFQSFLNARRMRLSQNQSGMPLILWVNLFVGAFITISFAFLIYAHYPIRQLIFTAMVSLLIAMQLSLIIEFEYPYQGVIVLRPTGWENFLQKIETHSFYSRLDWK